MVQKSADARVVREYRSRQAVERGQKSCGAFVGRNSIWCKVTGYPQLVHRFQLLSTFSRESKSWVTPVSVDLRSATLRQAWSTVV